MKKPKSEATIREEANRARVLEFLQRPDCLKGRIDARRQAAMESGPGTDDYRVNMQKAAELERQARGGVS